MPRPTRPAKLAEGELLRRVHHAVTSGEYRILPHARQRCTERDVAAADIEHALEMGRRVKARDRFDELHAAWSYCLHGPAIDRDELRVIVAFENWMLVVTVVRLGSDAEKDKEA